MDLSKYDTKTSANEGAWFNLRDPGDISQPIFADDEKTKPARLKLLGKDSIVFERETARFQNARFADQAKRGRPSALTKQALNEQTIAVVAACTVAMENIIIDGLELKAPEDCVAFYKRFPAFLEQAEDFLGDRANFTKGTETT